MAEQQKNTEPASSQEPISSEKSGKLDFSKIKNVKDWLTAAIGAAATALIPNIIFKGLVVAGAPFLADGILWSVKAVATEYKTHRKNTEPLRLARGYRTAIDKRLKKVNSGSPEWRQLQSDRAEIAATIHQLEMQRIRFSVSNTWLSPTSTSPATLPPPIAPIPNANGNTLPAQAP